MLKIIGIGNALRGDDAIGPHIIELLLQDTSETAFQAIDVGADAFSMLEHLIGQEPLLIIDCAKMGGAPGDIRLFDVNEANIAQAAKMVSLHGFGFGDVYQMAKNIGPVVSCKIIGVEPKEVAFDTEISAEVKKSIPEILRLVHKEAKNYA